MAFFQSFFRSGARLKAGTAALAFGGGAGYFAYCQNDDISLADRPWLRVLKAKEERPLRGAHANLHPPPTAEFPPKATWDNNWDKRQPECVVKPLKVGASDEEIAAYKEKVANATPTAVRKLVLVRHGQYNLSGGGDAERYLTALGQEQADLTGQRLAEIRKHYLETPGPDGKTKTFNVSVVMSTMTRATETAQIILKHFPDVPWESCNLIREGAPCEPVPNASSVWDPEPHLFFEEGARIEAGFRKYFHRADPSQKEDSIELLVCHGNVIRYFVCRALQLPPQAWLRFALHNGSFTTVTIQPTGRVSISAIGETGHLPTSKLTFN